MHRAVRFPRLVRRHPRVSLALGTLAALAVVFAWPRSNPAKEAAQTLRRQLHAQGFKTEPTDFNLDIGPTERARMAVLTNAGIEGSLLDGQSNLVLMKTIGTNSARVLWRTAHIGSQERDVDWDGLREYFKENDLLFGRARAVLLAGPVRTETLGHSCVDPLLPHIPQIRALAKTLALRSVIQMHDGNGGAAWDDMRAATSLATKWQPEPLEVCQLVRLRCVPIAQSALWELLQRPGWTEDQLRLLQQEWESAEFLSVLPDTAAMDRVCHLAECAYRVAEPWTNYVSSLSMEFKDILKSPGSVSWRIKGWWQGHQREGNYRSYGVYEDEREVLLYFTEQEKDLKAAVMRPNWREMLATAAVTNRIEFHGSDVTDRLTQRIRSRKMMLSMLEGEYGLPGRAAEAEIRRRIIVTALALERYRLRSGGYPASLDGLVPMFLSSVPVDFSDGQPLRYHRLRNGRFQLYSIGLDCEDDGGRQPSQQELMGLMNWEESWGAKGIPPKTFDLIWPLPAEE